MFAILCYSNPAWSAVALGIARRVGITGTCGLCVLAFALLATAARAATPRGASELESLETELDVELQLVYRDNVPEFKQRGEQVSRAVAAWDASTKSAADQARMTAWLREAIHVSMPGSTKALPPLPTFSSNSVNSEQVSKVALVPPAPPTQSQKSIVVAPSKAPTAPAGKPAAPQPPAARPAASPASPDGDPFQDDPPSGEDHQQSSNDAVRIRLDELMPRVEGYEMALRQIDSKLIGGHLATNDLVQVASDVEQLAERWKLLSLYMGALTPAERRAVPLLRDLQSTTALLAQCVAERQAVLQEKAALSFADQEAAQEGEILHRLADKLKKSLAMHWLAK
jgi:hypothetical protein